MSFSSKPLLGTGPYGLEFKMRLHEHGAAPLGYDAQHSIGI
jgi:hypothetical protein